jgi:hypothetical protein
VDGNHYIYALLHGAKSLRVLLFLKLTEVSWRSKAIFKTFQKSYRELLLSIFFILISLMIASTLMFYVEAVANKNGQPSSLNSIPLSFWWAVVTMSTVIWILGIFPTNNF